MIKVRFTYDGRHKGWRYREGEEILLPDGLGMLAISEGMATKVIQKETAVNHGAYRAFEEAKRSLK